MNKARFVWMIKQLLPLKYKSHIQEKPITWRMWFGKCFCIDKES